MKKGQVTIFVAIAVIILASILLFFLLRREIFPARAEAVPIKLRPFSEAYSLCLRELADEGTTLLGQRGGYIYLPEKQEGSDFMPFGNQLNFLGNEIPYWFFISANGLQEQQVPSIFSMEKELQRYVEENVERCDSIISQFAEQGFEIEKKGTAEVNARIREEDVSVRVFAPLLVKLADARARVDVYELALPISLGRSFNSAKKIMDKENADFFVEEKTIDALFLYDELPSTKTTLECNPRNWDFEEVENDLKIVLENNLPFMKVKGTNYAKAEANSYYELDAGISDSRISANFIFVDEPFKLEINGKKDGILTGESIQKLTPATIRNLFCLSGYDFVYTIAYPMLVVLYDSKSDYQFQFPFVAYVNKNQPRSDALSEDFTEAESEICNNKLAKENVFTFKATEDSITPLEDVLISYKCINSVCPIGTTKLQGDNAELSDYFPQCLNGFIIAEKEGFAKAKQQISTIESEQSINLNLQPLTSLDVELLLIDTLGGERSLQADETAVIAIVNEEQEVAETLIYPEQRKVSLASGDYKVRIQVFKDRKLTLESQEREICTKIPAGGILSIFGFKQQSCSTIEIPSLEVDSVLFGGTEFSFFANVDDKRKIVFYAIENPIPQDVEELNEIYADVSLNANSPLFKEPEII